MPPDSPASAAQARAAKVFLWEHYAVSIFVKGHGVYFMGFREDSIENLKRDLSETTWCLCCNVRRMVPSHGLCLQCAAMMTTKMKACPKDERGASLISIKFLE